MKLKLFALMLFLMTASFTYAVPPAKTVTLTWTASVSPSVTYNVYRSTTIGSCFTTKIASGITPTNYLDNTVTAGTTYFYAVSSTSQTGGESTSCSNEVQIAVPTPPSPPTNLQGQTN